MLSLLTLLLLEKCECFMFLLYLKDCEGGEEGSFEAHFLNKPQTKPHIDQVINLESERFNISNGKIVNPNIANSNRSIPPIAFDGRFQAVNLTGILATIENGESISLREPHDLSTINDAARASH